MYANSSTDTYVSMKSGLEGRNNAAVRGRYRPRGLVSMKSGLEGRNNPGGHDSAFVEIIVSQ